MCSLAWNRNFTFICVLPVQFSHSLMHEYHNVSLSPSLFLSLSLSHSCHVAAYDDTQKGVSISHLICLYKHLGTEVLLQHLRHKVSHKSNFTRV